MTLRVVLSFLALLAFCPPAFSEIVLSIDAEQASIRQRPDRKDNYIPNTTDGDLIDNGLILEGQVQGYGRPPTLSTTEYRQGSHSLMFQAQPNQRGKERTEIWFEGSRVRPRPFDPTFSYGSQTNVIPWGEERYTGFSFKLPADYPVGRSNFIMQFWQRSPDAPPLSLQLFRKDGRLKCTLAVKNDRGGGQVVDRFPVTRGIWHDVILHYTFSRNPRVGFVTAWVRPENRRQYRRLRAYKGAIGFRDRGRRRKSRGLFHKFGLYRPAKDDKQHTIFFDEIRNARPSPTVFYEIDPALINPRQPYGLKNVGASAALASTRDDPARAQLSTETTLNGWQFVYVGDGYYQLLHTLNRQALTATGKDSGAPVQLAAPSSQTRQHWYLVDQGNGNYHIVNRASRLVLTGNWGASRGNTGDALSLAPAGPSSTQLWRFER